MGHLTELEEYLHWLERIIRGSHSELQVLYGLRGEAELKEQELPHWEGYKGSRPVRISG
ncbi:hypothetical protein [Nitrosococcus wardiae]|uniref:hypothetical protein n=1 Tax=Nitrosococcus wardiae TaxID=1814290 RepID=UPI00141BCD4D|nr:hypothetical protein [Nitrosococcus wardiae]